MANKSGHVTNTTANCRTLSGVPGTAAKKGGTNSSPPHYHLQNQNKNETSWKPSQFRPNDLRIGLDGDFGMPNLNLRSKALKSFILGCHNQEIKTYAHEAYDFDAFIKTQWICINHGSYPILLDLKKLLLLPDHTETVFIVLTNNTYTLSYNIDQIAERLRI